MLEPMAMSNSSFGCGCLKNLRLLSCLALLAASRLPAQDLMQPSEPGGVVRLLGSDMAMLEAQDTRKDLPCTVTPVVKPALGFDMKFHAGYDVQVPLKELAGEENQLTMVFRVTPEGHADSPIFFKQHYSVPT